MRIRKLPPKQKFLKPADSYTCFQIHRITERAPAIPNIKVQRWKEEMVLERETASICVLQCTNKYMKKIRYKHTSQPGSRKTCSTPHYVNTPILTTVLTSTSRNHRTCLNYPFSVSTLAPRSVIDHKILKAVLRNLNK